MPRIARYAEGTSIPRPRLTASARPDPSAGAGLDALAEGLQQVGTIIEQEAEADAVSWVSQVAADAKVHWAQREAELRSEAGEGARGHTKRVTGELDEWVNQTLAEAPNDLAREMAVERLGNLGSSLRARAVTFEHGAVTAQRATNFGLTVDKLAEAVRLDVMSRDDALAQFDGDLAAAAKTWMLPEAVSNWRIRRESLFQAEQMSAIEERLTARVRAEPWRYVARMTSGGTRSDGAAVAPRVAGATKPATVADTTFEALLAAMQDMERLQRAG